MGGDSVFCVSDGVAKLHNLFGERASVEHVGHGLGSRLILLGWHHARLDMLGRGTSQDVALEIGRGEQVSRGSRRLLLLLLGRGALLLIRKTSCGLVRWEHELVRTVEVWHESGARSVHVGVEADLGLRRVLKRGVLRKLLRLGLGLASQEGLISKEIRKLGRGIREGSGERVGRVPVDFAAWQRDPGDESGFGGGARCENCRAVVAVAVVVAGAVAGSGGAELTVAGCDSGSWGPLGTGYDPPSDRAGRRGLRWWWEGNEDKQSVCGSC